MFNKLTNKIYNTIKYTVLLLAFISFITMIVYSVTVVNSDYNTKASQLAQQYAECLEIQINSSTKPTMLIKDNLNDAIQQNNTVQLETLKRTVRMANPAITEFYLSINDSSVKNTPGYKLKNGSNIEYTVQYNFPDNKNVYGVLQIQLSSIVKSLKLESNVFMKDSDIYISQDDNTYYYIETQRQPKEYKKSSYSKDELEQILTATSKRTEILGGEFIIYTVPKPALIPTIIIYIIICFSIFILLVLLALGIIKKYTGNTEKQLNNLVKDMDEYIQNKEDEEDENS